jgi:hypothetical protein
MKTSTILIVIWLCFGSLQAQQIIEKHLSTTGKESVKLNIQIADSITLQTWNKNEVYVKASVNVNDNRDNEAYLTRFDEEGDDIIVNAKLQEKYFKGKNNCCNEIVAYWQVFVPANIDFSIETINGNITITGQTKSMDVKSISGYIDLSVPSERQADIDFSTISGTMYTNHDLAPHKTHSSIPSKIYEKLNSGGPAIKLETISGDIFFRKSN